MIGFCAICGNYDLLNALGHCTCCAIIIEEWDLDPTIYDHVELA